MKSWRNECKGPCEASHEYRAGHEVIAVKTRASFLVPARAHVGSARPIDLTRANAKRLYIRVILDRQIDRWLVRAWMRVWMRAWMDA
jgi:hypothetical protein